MLLTITTTHRPATDLGFLLHKHPDRVQTFPVGFGEAHVLYPEAREERCSAALVLDVDPVGLVRRGKGVQGFALAEYVNDRPYVASSFLSVALVNVFKTAMAGTCRGHEDLAAAAIALEASLPVVPARGGEALVRRLFEPLGYTVDVEPIALDGAFPAWGDSRHVALRLAGRLRLADLLNHLYVLLPVLDDDKHYWVDEAEIEKLLRRREGWLGDHPERELIVRRYLKKQARLYFPALAQLDEAAPPSEEPDAPGARSDWRSASRCATSAWARCRRCSRPPARGACSTSAAGPVPSWSACCARTTSWSSVPTSASARSNRPLAGSSSTSCTMPSGGGSTCCTAP